MQNGDDGANTFAPWTFRPCTVLETYIILNWHAHYVAPGVYSPIFPQRLFRLYLFVVTTPWLLIDNFVNNHINTSKKTITNIPQSKKSTRQLLFTVVGVFFVLALLG